MAGFINWECGAEGDNSDDDFEDFGDSWSWRRNGRARGTGRGRRANRNGRGGGRVGTLRRGGGNGTLPEPEGGH